MNKNNTRLSDYLIKNMVTIFFIIICIIAFVFSGSTLESLAMELFTRIGRNAFLVLALIIPVLTGMGLNFSIIIGAMAAQIGVFIVVNNGWTGIPGFLLCVLFATPLALVFGFLVGKLFNKMNGSEMIGGLVLGYFSDGLYLFLFLFILGGIVPIKNSKLSISGNIGVINSIDLTGSLKYVLDSIKLITIVDFVFYTVLAITIIALIYNCAIKKKPISESTSYIFALVLAIVMYGLSYIPAISSFLGNDKLVLLDALSIAIVAVIVYQIARILLERFTNTFKQSQSKDVKQRIITIVVALISYGLTYIPAIEKAALAVNIPVMTFMCIIALYLFNGWIMKTKLGQNMRTVGQSNAVANSAGIQVNKIRIIAILFSTVFASWGQLIYLQNLGTFPTYSAHTQVGLYAIASLLVGGASVKKATSKQAIIGVILFHTLAILSPQAGTMLFNNSQLGEYFRIFVTYSVIAISLAMHAYNSTKKSGNALANNFDESNEKATTAA